MDKENYYLKSLEIIKSLPKDHKPRLLIHACCGPCSTYPLLFLAPHFEVTIYYQNSNIYPEAEFNKRIGELKKLLTYYKRDYGYTFELIEPPYDENFLIDLIPFADEKEGGSRCVRCYSKRMQEGYAYAHAHNYDYFATLMTISREKDSNVLNKLGEALEKKYAPTKYFYSDFKKAQGADYALRLRKHYDLYYQNYCGCPFTKEDLKEELLAYYEKQKESKL